MGLLSYLHVPTFNLHNRLHLPTRFTRDLIIGLIVGITLSLSSTSLALLAQGYRRRRAIARIPPRPIELRSDEVVDGVIGLIGRSSGVHLKKAECAR
jgi:cysteine synthase A